MAAAPPVGAGFQLLLLLLPALLPSARAEPLRDARSPGSFSSAKVERAPSLLRRSQTLGSIKVDRHTPSETQSRQDVVRRRLPGDGDTPNCDCTAKGQLRSDAGLDAASTSSSAAVHSNCNNHDESQIGEAAPARRKSGGDSLLAAKRVQDGLKPRAGSGAWRWAMLHNWLYFVSLGLSMVNLPLRVAAVVNPDGSTAVTPVAIRVSGDIEALDNLLTFIGVGFLGSLSDVIGRRPLMAWSSVGFGTTCFLQVGTNAPAR
eukprot:6190239-Pleurochrysis_carterae.AAC.1